MISMCQAVSLAFHGMIPAAEEELRRFRRPVGGARFKRLDLHVIKCGEDVEAK